MKNAKLFAVWLLALTLFLSARAQTNPPQITGLVSTQRLGTMFVDITFNLLDADNQGAYVLLECDDGSSTYGVPIYALSGDVGFVTPGNGRHIVWDAWRDWAGNYTTNAKVRLIADASFKGVVLNTTTSAPPATNLVWIPSGTFVMSAGPNVYLSRGFWMGRFEVTQGEFTVVMTNNPSSFSGSSNLPADSVTWDEAVLYCQRLNVREQGAGRLPAGWSYRLPTEAEWEYACRAGTTTTWYFGEAERRLPFYAWFAAISSNQTHVVGGRIPNRWGLYDLYGNVAEWCSDLAEPLDVGNVTDPKGPTSGGYEGRRVIRGHSWSQGAGTSGRQCYWPWDCGMAALPDSRDASFGFRVVLAPN